MGAGGRRMHGVCCKSTGRASAGPERAVPGFSGHARGRPRYNVIHEEGTIRSYADYILWPQFGSNCSVCRGLWFSILVCPDRQGSVKGGSPVRVRKAIRWVLRDLADTVFPRVCPLCFRGLLEEGDGLCGPCLATVELIRPPVCAICGAILPGRREGSALLCPRCVSDRARRNVPSPIVRSVALYSGRIREAVHRLKYSGQLHVAPALGALLRDHGPRLHPGFVPDRLLPVPLHPARLRERGFNQCVQICRPLARRLGVPADIRSVVRVIRSTPQVRLRGPARRTNLAGAFHVARPGDLLGTSLLGVDDVYTTGATVDALARALLAAGARDVRALTLARSPLRRPDAASRMGGTGTGFLDSAGHRV